MGIDLSQWSLRFLCKVYHYTDCIAHPELVLVMLDAVMREFDEFCFDDTVTANPLGSFRQRRLQPNPRNWAKVRSELQSGQISTLAFGSSTVDGRDLQIDIAFHLSNAARRTRWPNSEELCDSMSISIAASALHSTTLAACQQIMRKAWEEFGAAYAYADMFTSHQTGLVSPWVEPIAARTLKAHLRTSHTDLPGIDLRSYVPDAYWLNLLNASHVDRLGGIEQIKAKLPGEMILEPLAHDGLAITISRSPLYGAIENWSADHWALRQVLEPIVIGR
jgi:hypothetical protein